MKKAVLRFAVIGSALVIAVAAGGVAHAQTATAPSQSQKKTTAPFNSGSGTGETAPVFIQKGGQQPGGMITGILPRQNAVGMKSANVASSPENVRKAKVAFDEARAKQEAVNQKIRNDRMASMISQFEATKAQEMAADEQRMLAKKKEMGLPPVSSDPSVIPTRTVPVEEVDPYAGSDVIFANPKKANTPADKTPRLFNTPE